MRRAHVVIALAFSAMLLLAVITTFVFVRGRIVYVAHSTPTPIHTPMPVRLRMRDADGNVQQIWFCQYDRKRGWLCEEEKDD